MTNQTEYAATSYNTPAEATGAAVMDWLTAGGNNDAADMAREVREDGEFLASELAEDVACGDWYIPNVLDADDPAVAIELLLDAAGEILG